MNILRRDRYLERLGSGRDITDIVKVITGMRRVGKSTLMRQFREDLLAEGVPEDRAVYINLDDFDYSGVETHEQLDGIVRPLIKPDGITYFFLDEVQNVDGWERTLSSMINTGLCDIYVTGSNSKMLSSELSTHISGRYVEIKVFPLSFSEYMELHPGDIDSRFGDYLRYGSLPEVDPDRGEEFCMSQIGDIFNTVLVRDVLDRIGKGDFRTLRAITRFLYSNVGNVTNMERVSKDVGISSVTASRYVEVLSEAFLFYESERYDIIGRRILKTNGKFYASDLGMRNHALQGAGLRDVSRPLENIVYLELLRRGYTVRIGCYRDREVDFTAVRGETTEYFQVTQTMASADTSERELRSLRGIGDNFPKTVLTLDRFGLGNEDGISVRNAVDWLLEKD